MSSYIYGIVAIIILFIAGWVVLERANLFVMKDMIIEGLIDDVSNFYQEEKRLPLNWDEFASWAKMAHTARHWTSEELVSRFSLKWGARITSSSQSDKIFIVVDPKYKDVELVANRRLIEKCSMNSTRQP